MKNLILSSVSLLFTMQVFSQDILTMRTGSKYEVKLLEITDTQLRFKMFNNPDGPVYNISRSSFASVRYENGVEEVFAQQPQQNAETIAINGYNTSASASTDLPGTSPADVTPEENKYPVPTYQVQKKKTTFGEVMGAIVITGLMALDVAAKVDAHANKCAQKHSHSHNCR